MIELEENWRMILLKLSVINSHLVARCNIFIFLYRIEVNRYIRNLREYTVINDVTIVLMYWKMYYFQMYSH